MGTARGIRTLRTRAQVGTAVQGAATLAGQLGSSASRRSGAAAPVAELPFGVWPRPVETGVGASIAAGLDPALAGYAAMLRRKQRPKRVSQPKVLPLIARRAGDTRQGAGTGPGGLARRSVPVDEPVQPLEGRLSRDPLTALRASNLAAGTPGAGTPRPAAAAGRSRSPQRGR